MAAKRNFPAKTDFKSLKALSHAFLALDIQPTKLSPLVVKHPFTDSGIVGLRRDNGYMSTADLTSDPAALQVWREQTGQLIDEVEKPFALFLMITKPYKLAFLKHAAPFLSEQDILTNEKYAGDVIRQKTFVADPISKRVVKNTGQLPMYLLKNHHEGIVDKATYNAVRAEWARRNAKRTPSVKTAPTGKGCYASKYALSERLVCGECGSNYRRCVWSKRGKKRIVWRCVSRLDYGTKYCHDSPTLDESVIQKAILTVLNAAMGRKDELIHHITNAMAQELISIPGEAMSLADIERRLEEINQETHAIVVKSSRRDDKYKGFTEQLPPPWEPPQGCSPPGPRPSRKS